MVKMKRVENKLKEAKVYHWLEQVFPVYTKEILLVLMIVIVILAVGRFIGERPEKVESIKRPDYLEGDTGVTLYYKDNFMVENAVEFEVEAKEMAEGEKEALVEEAKGLVYDYLENQYDGYTYITDKLDLVDSYKDAKISYTFSEPGIIDSLGWVNFEKIEEPMEVTIFYNVLVNVYDDMPKESDGEIVIVFGPDSFTKEYKDRYLEHELLLFKEMMNEDLGSETIVLPDYITLKDSKEAYSGKMILLIGIVLATVMALLSRYEKQQLVEEAKRQKGIQLMYLINNFLMLYRSGMTLYKSFLKALYNRLNTLEEGAFYDELNELTQFTKEHFIMGEIMEAFVKVFDIKEGYRFARLLKQNERQGDHTLDNQLEMLSASMWDERIRKARKDSEKASSKLVFPMLLIFIVIIMITIVPTFMEVNQML